MSRFVSTSTAGTGRACMIAAIATDTERAGTVAATDITLKAASMIAGAAANTMVATRASNGRDAAKTACRPLLPGKNQAQTQRICDGRYLTGIATSYSRERDQIISSFDALLRQAAK